MTKSAGAMTLEERFLLRPRRGALQNRIKKAESQLQEDNGALFAAVAARLGRHAAQLVIEIQESGLPLVRSYEAAVPVFGPSSKLARESATVMIDPGLTTVTKLS